MTTAPPPLLPPPAAAAPAAPPRQGEQKIKDEQIEHYLQIAQGYVPFLKLRIKRYKADYRIQYVLVDEDPSTGGWTELSRAMSKAQLYDCLFTMCSLYARVEKRKWERWEKLRAEQERERWLWERVK
jgi:hypothetical protein